MGDQVPGLFAWLREELEVRYWRARGFLARLSAQPKTAATPDPVPTSRMRAAARPPASSITEQVLAEIVRVRQPIRPELPPGGLAALLPGLFALIFFLALLFILFSMVFAYTQLHARPPFMFR